MFILVETRLAVLLTLVMVAERLLATVVREVFKAAISLVRAFRLAEITEMLFERIDSAFFAREISAMIEVLTRAIVEPRLFSTCVARDVSFKIAVVSELTDDVIEKREVFKAAISLVRAFRLAEITEMLFERIDSAFFALEISAMIEVLTRAIVEPRLFSTCVARDVSFKIAAVSELTDDVIEKFKLVNKPFRILISLAKSLCRFAIIVVAKDYLKIQQRVKKWIFELTAH